MKKIINVNYGLASSYDGFIEINRKLKGKLRKKILDHEKRHENGRYSLKDFKIDFQSKKPHFFEAFLFSLKNPESLINYFLIMYSYYGKIWTFSLTSLFPLIYYGIIFTFFFVFLFKISVFMAILGWICIYVILNISLLIYTHWYVLKHQIYP